MLKKAIKTAIGFLLLPLVASASIAFYRQFGNIEVIFSRDQQYFLWGIIAYCLIQLLIFKPSFIYVLGHETVHALATWLCLGKVTSFDVSSSGGSVSTSKTNLFISLSPYFVPVYAILLTVLYYIINDVFLWGFLARPYFLFLLGTMLCFHIVMTIDTLKIKQPDLVKAGYLTSSILIYVINLILAAGILGLLFYGFSFRSFIKSSYVLTLDIYNVIFKQLF
jgi:hypothetical protein